MGSLSIWHLLVVLLVMGLGAYVIYRAIKTRNPILDGSAGPLPVGGWLILLVAGLTVLGPLVAAGQMSQSFFTVESDNPNFAALDVWQRYKSAAWWTFIGFSALSFYAGWGLAKGRTMAVVTRAKIVLWLIGPVESIALTMLLPLLIFGRVPTEPEVFVGILQSCIPAAVWTAYLFRSKRVRATYGLTPKVEVAA